MGLPCDTHYLFLSSRWPAEGRQVQHPKLSWKSKKSEKPKKGEKVQKVSWKKLNQTSNFAHRFQCGETISYSAEFISSESAFANNEYSTSVAIGLVLICCFISFIFLNASKVVNIFYDAIG